MILSNVSIHDALDRGWLSIDPAPMPRAPENGSDCPYQTSAVDLRLADEIAYFVDNLAFTIDLAQGDFAPLFGKNSNRVTITDEQPFCLLPQRMVIGKTLEKVTLPLIDNDPCLAARVEGKS